MGRLTTVLSIMLLSLSSWTAHAAGELDFTQGVALYKKENYAAALARFEAAKNAGMKEPRLDFNLALCNLKLHHYDLARNYFLQSARHEPLQGLAYFNIGLLELKRGYYDEAKLWFERVRDNETKSKLGTLASLRLVQLERPVFSEIPRVKWESGYRFHLGYDDNIEDPSQIHVADKGDSFASILFYSTRDEGGDNGFRAGLMGYMQHYSRVTSYDLDLLRITLDKGFVQNEWRNRLGIELESSTLGSSNYLLKTKMHLDGSFSLSSIDDLRLRYRFSDISALSNSYNYLAGKRHELEFRWQHKQRAIQFQTGYEFEYNERNDYTGTTIFSSYSPTRHTIDLRAETALTQDWRLGGRCNWRKSLYEDANILIDSSRVKRSDDRLALSVAIMHKLGDGLELDFEYKFTDNYSNISAYRYTRNIYSISITGTF